MTPKPLKKLFVTTFLLILSTNLSYAALSLNPQGVKIMKVAVCGLYTSKYK
ncbi:MAG: hypothetical protein HY093_03175 [Candidatus Liptonbacteria bacterium]|nr:hypothetical protein [Candidatus Liptonbacteria bacterium]